MAHPYKDQANSSHKSKASSMGKTNNLDIPVMRAVGENSGKKLYSSSSNSMQHKDQSAASGMKRGGHVGKPKHKTKIAMVAPPPDPAAPPDPAMAAAGAGPAPAPAPMPPGAQPPMKLGGKVTGGADSGTGRLQHSKAIARSGLKAIKG